MNVSQIIRAAIPEASDELCEHILWSRTPFPVGAVNAKSLYCAASRLDRAHKHGLVLCEFCDNVRTHKWTCDRCEEYLS